MTDKEALHEMLVRAGLLLEETVAEIRVPAYQGEGRDHNGHVDLQFTFRPDGTLESLSGDG